MVGESQEAVGVGGGTGPSSNKMPTLEEYGNNLTNQAKEVSLESACMSVDSAVFVTAGSCCQLCSQACWASPAFSALVCCAGQAGPCCGPQEGD